MSANAPFSLHFSHNLPTDIFHYFSFIRQVALLVTLCRASPSLSTHANRSYMIVQPLVTFRG